MSQTIVFFGGDSKTGTTMVSRSVAEYLGKNGEKVLYLQCGGKIEDAFSGVHSKGIDDLKANILSGRLSRGDIMQVTENTKDFSVIRGVRNPYGSKYFPENTADLILSAVEGDYQYMVMDAGSDIDLGLAVSALNKANRRYYLVTQQRKVLERYLYLRKEILTPLKLTGSLIINKYIKEPSLYRKREIESLCKSGETFVVPWMEYGWQAEAEGKTLMNFPKFRKSIGHIAGDITGKKKGEALWKRNFA